MTCVLKWKYTCTGRWACGYLPCGFLQSQRKPYIYMQAHKHISVFLVPFHLFTGFLMAEQQLLYSLVACFRGKEFTVGVTEAGWERGGGGRREGVWMGRRTRGLLAALLESGEMLKKGQKASDHPAPLWSCPGPFWEFVLEWDVMDFLTDPAVFIPILVVSLHCLTAAGVWFYRRQHRRLPVFGG